MAEESLNLIAIVGIGLRVPGADHADAFWQNLCEGLESITRFAPEALEDSFDAQTRSRPDFVRARAVLRDIEQFDAGFFGMHAREAALTDPQHRLLLECAWEAFEDAGHDPAQIRGAVGVFAGSSLNTYFLRHVLRDRATIERFTSDYQIDSYPMLLGAGQDFTATRLAYRFDLRGPAININSACSTSLLAVAQACQSLLLFQCDAALAGGASISLPQARGYRYSEGGMGSRDGHVRSFDAEASGTVFGSGAGLVLLKRLEDALADGDSIHAVIRGCGVNNDGRLRAGFTAPSARGQADCIAMALADAGVSAADIDYVECHGTATPLGDPIEIAGLTQAFRRDTEACGHCRIGSVKTNIGHLDAAAGIAGLVKTALMLKHARMPASLHYRQPNPQIYFANTPFVVNAELRDWPATRPRRAGVSAFGVGGTNVHVVLEEPPAASPSAAESGPQLLLLSARDEAALSTARQRLAQHLRAQPELALADVAWTLQAGRAGFDQRLAFVADSAADAIARLEDGALTSRKKPAAASVVFMFPGQGSQYPDMGRGLYETQSVFRAALDDCAAQLLPQLGVDLRAALHAASARADAAAALMDTALAQPAIFAVEYALAQLWLSWGIRPVAMIGHSVGEFVAATLAGVFTLADALAIVATRARLMSAQPPGRMLAVRLAEQDLRARLPPAVEIAAVNGPMLCVVSGPADAIADFEARLQSKNVATRALHASHAFHSSMVDPVLLPLEAAIAARPRSGPTIPCMSCVSADWLSAEQAQSARYWARHAREPVRFADGLARLLALPGAVLIEVGAGRALGTLALQCARTNPALAVRAVLASLPDADRDVSDLSVMLDSLGRCWQAGLQPDWSAVHGSTRQRVRLPTYAFQRSRHWIDPPASTTQEVAAEAAVPADSPEATGLSEETDMASTVDAPLAHHLALQQSIVAILEDLSGEPPPLDQPEASFLELGYDSLFLTQVAQRIQREHQVTITFRQLLGECANMPALVRFLAERTKPATPAPSPAVAPLATAAASASGGANLEQLFRDQLAALTQLISQQNAALQAQAAAQAQAQKAATAPAIPDAEHARPSRFSVYKPAVAKLSQAMTPEQTAHLATLVEQYSTRLAGSKRMSQAHRAVLADPRTAAGFRSEWKEMVFPVVAARSKGSRIIDVDGNEYIDLVNGYGQTAFGHAPDFVSDAVRAQLDRGYAIGPQSELAGEVAALFAEMTGHERVTFCNTGSEAVMAAMRVARSVTGRSKVAVFNGAYHGQFDEVLVKGVQRPGAAPRSRPVANGIPDESVANMVVLDYGTPESLVWLRAHADELAAVVVETVQSRNPTLLPIEFLRELRAISEASGTAFVMDEVVTGFRVHAGGMQALTGIRADLATYGKVVGGGLPIGVLAGSARFMDALDGGLWQYGDDSFPPVGVTFFAGTFVRHPLALAAVRAVLEHLKAEGPALQQRLDASTATLVEALNAEFEAHGLKTRIERHSSWFHFNLHDEHALASLLYYHLRLRGIHIQEGFPCFLTTAHSAQDLQRIIEAFRDSLSALQAVGVFGHGVAAPAPARDLPLTEPQLEVWLAAQRSEELSCAFNESISLHLRGRLDTCAVQRALDGLAARHDALRARFAATGEALHLDGPARIPLTVSDLSQADEAALSAVLDADAATPFDLVKGPLVRAQLLRLTDEQHVFVLTAHHIICDGWSFNILVDELAALYEAARTGKPAALAPAASFAAHARAQAARSGARDDAAQRYWLAQFAEAVTLPELPTDRPRGAQRTARGATLSHRIPAALMQAVKQTGARHGSTLFASLLAAFAALAGRLSASEDIVVAVPTAGQSLLDGEILVGHCVNFLPIRLRWDAQTTVAEHLAHSAHQVLDAFDHRDYTLGTLVRALNPPRVQNRLPLTELQFNLERLAERIELPGLAIEVEPNAKASVNYDLFLNVIESGSGLRLDCDYNRDLFDAASVQRLLEAYEALLQDFVARPSQRLVTANFMPPALRAQVLDQWNDTARDYADGLCLQQLIETQAAATPDAIAVVFRDQHMSYAALDQRANRIANELLARLAPGRAPVAVMIERSLDLPAVLLAVLKTGRAYLPLDPTHPPARQRLILEEAEIAALIVDDAAAAAQLSPDTPRLCLTADAAAIARAPSISPSIGPSHSHEAGSPAYLIYTSGSTGRPKGVAVSHRSVVNLLCSMAREPGLTSSDILFAVTTVSFDIAALELFLPLITGGQVVIAEAAEIADGFALARHIHASQASVMQATPATWRLLLEAGFRPAPGFRMLCGGEALPRALADALLACGEIELWNLYGPTETTIWSSCDRVRPGTEPITIGRPIANTRFHVLDANDQPLPPGLPGQLHIGGAGVALGYYRREALTAERFIADPFLPEAREGRLYRTGDLARWLPDGRMQHLGRMDHQAKLRGFRIELGEIESCLVEHGGVAQAVVVLREDPPGAARLAAYYVERSGHRREPEALREALAHHLPDYMLPAAWLRLDRFPQTANGKLDRAALPPAELLQRSTSAHVEPATAVERTLVRIWMDVLRLDRVSVLDDLFALGADSIQLFQIAARASREQLALSARQLIQLRTIRALASALASEAAVTETAANTALPSLQQFRRRRVAGSDSR